MCGIAGIVRWKNGSVQHAELERMTAAIAHRGPDGVGLLRRDSVGLGHRRLAIIDPELGHQPMSNEDETIWLTYNGEMYNYRELKQELATKGHRFTTNSDTEVVIHAYQEWGVDCLKKFRGMFAFAMADLRSRQLFVARDHFGIKPLYYRLSSDYFAFGSELVALRQVDDVAPEGNLWAVELFLRYQYIPTPHTIYKDTFKLPPASYVVVGFDGGTTGPVKYWDLQFQPKRGVSAEAAAEEAEAVITESVRAHMVSDVPYGVFLSGGIDSSLVALKMSQLLERPVRAFAIGFKEEGYSELPFAEEVAAKAGIQLTTHIVEDDSLDFLPELIAHYGEPFGDSSAIPTWHVSRLAREKVPMVLSGDGGDEGFAGYPNYQFWLTSDSLYKARQDFPVAPRASFYWLRQAIKNRYRSGVRHQLDEWEQFIYYLNRERRQSLWREEFHNLLDPPCELFADAHRRAQRNDRVAYAQYLDFQTYLPCDILTKVDVASMYHGLEVRTPLIDLQVLKFASSLPLKLRIERNGSPELIPKYLLKKLLSRTMPAEFVHRKKQGFSIPRDRWFLPGQPAREMLNDVLLNRKSKLYDFFQAESIRGHLDAHSPQFDNSNALWLLLVLGIWLEQNSDINFG